MGSYIKTKKRVLSVKNLYISNKINESMLICNHRAFERVSSFQDVSQCD